ncbi:PaaI family thioesterase [Microbispora sp. RL4-1S]|uniref:PaaI family thioesterase n=1 Tax=Microbispora oryzae TaxID=2806554 RepID=A0A940WMZ9_9ACTN|nr:PaaI family thioesterase [Microbispora oryzae]MBP2706832.1 PaaI family thioesterase [Microbispora oryzae]
MTGGTTREDTMPDTELTVETLKELMPFAETVGIRFDRLTPGEVTALLGWAPERCTAGGVLHGAALTALADSTAAVCAFLNLPPGAATSTIELKINFLAAVRRGEVRASARPVHVGRTSIVVQTDLHTVPAGDEEPRRVGLVVQTQAVLT